MLRERKLDLRDHNSIRLDRNEKVKNWNKKIFLNIIKKNKSYKFNIHPNIPFFYKIISKYLDVPQENILITSGIDGATKQIFETFTRPKDCIIKLNPTWKMFEVYSKAFKTKALNLNFNKKLELNLKNLKSFFKKKPKLIFLSYPNSPIEGNLDYNLMKKIIYKTPKSCQIIIDEAYFGFGSNTFKNLALKKTNVIVARSFSKTFGLPSIRLGFLISNKNKINKIAKKRLSYETNMFSMIIAEYFMKNIHLIKKFQKEIINSRLWLKLQLSKLKVHSYSNSAYGLLIRLETNNLIHLKKLFRKNRIYVRFLDYPFKNYILITLGPKNIMKNFLDVFKKFIIEYD